MPALTAEQALELVRTKLAALEGEGECATSVAELRKLIAPENIVEPYSPHEVKAARYDGIIRWFGNNIRYMMSVGEDESLGVAIDEKLEEEEDERASRRASREAAGQ